MVSDKRLATLDLAKIIAILGVLALHTQRCTATQELYNPILYYLSRFCMPLFFMINGYLIMSKQSFDFAYYRRKVFNIIRILVLWAVVSFFYSFLYHGDSLTLAIRNFAVSMLGAYIIPAWFLITFILIYTVLLFGFDWIKKHIVPITVGLGVICLFIHILSLYNILECDGDFLQRKISQKFRLWTWLFYFFVGYLVKQANEKDKFKSLTFKWGGVIPSLLALCVQYYLCFKFLGRMNSEYMYDDPLIMLWSCSLFVLILNSKINDKAGVVITQFSSCMFGVFLLHDWFVDAFELNLLPSLAAFPWIVSTLLWFSLFTICTVLSFLIIKYGGKIGKMFMIY